MIVPEGPQFLAMSRYVGRPLILLLIYDIAVVAAFELLHWSWLGLPHLPIALMGSAIGIILGFRNQSSYARWWEARALWGSIVNNSRAWSRQVITAIVPPSEADTDSVLAMRRRLVHLQIAWVHALRQHLRGLEPWSELAPLMNETGLVALRKEKNVPAAIQLHMSTLLADCRARGWLDGFAWIALDASLNDLLGGQGGSERIKSTPMPKLYDYFPRLFVQMFCLMLPLMLVLNLGWFTPLGSTLVGFIFLALDEIGRDLENPFANRIFDVPLTAISTNIEINLRQMLGETNLPEPIPVVNSILW